MLNEFSHKQLDKTIQKKAQSSLQGGEFEIVDSQTGRNEPLKQAKTQIDDYKESRNHKMTGNLTESQTMKHLV